MKSPYRNAQLFERPSGDSLMASRLPDGRMIEKMFNDHGRIFLNDEFEMLPTGEVVLSPVNKSGSVQ